MDLMDMPLTAQGNRYVIVFIDYLTKWVEAYALSGQTRDNRECDLSAWSDHGASLLLTVMQEVCEVTGMVNVNTSSNRWAR